MTQNNATAPARDASDDCCAIWLGSRALLADFDPFATRRPRTAAARGLLAESMNSTLAISVHGDLSAGVSAHLLELLNVAERDPGVDRVLLFLNSERGDAVGLAPLAMRMCSLSDAKRVDAVVYQAVGVAAFLALQSHAVLATPCATIGGLQFQEFPGGIVNPPDAPRALFTILHMLRPGVSEGNWSRLEQGYCLNAEAAEEAGLVEKLAGQHAITELQAAL